MAGVHAISPYDTNSGSGAGTRVTNQQNTLDFQGFLKIIAAQMQNQSLSSSATDTSQYVMEMTLFSAIQSMRTMTQQSTREYASSLIGQDVILSKYNSTTGQDDTVSGTVEAVDYDPSTDATYLDIGGKAYDMTDLTDILGDHFSLGKGITAAGVQATRQYATSLIGRNVTLSVPNSTSKKNDTVTGTVEKVIFDASSGDISLQISGKAYSIVDLTEVLGQNAAGSDSQGFGEKQV